MLTISTFAFVLLATAVAAGWPLRTLPRIRAGLQLAGGTSCVAAGSTLMGLFAAGLIALPGIEQPQAGAAQETKTEDATLGVSVTTDPAITLDSSPTAAPADFDDIKIGTLPDGTIQIPAGRPQWVKDFKPNLSGPVHAIPVTSGPYKLTRDAERGLEDAMREATEEYIADQLGSPLAAKFDSYSVPVIQQRFVKETFHETLNFGDQSVGLMEQHYALLAFDESFRNEIKGHWAGRIAESRLHQIGLFAGAALLLLGSVFGYFRLDNATRGYYTGRLQFMAAAAILAIVMLGAVVAFRLTWL